MQNISANEAWLAFVVVILVLSAVLGVVEKIISIKKKVKEPEELQDNKLNELEDRVCKVERKLSDDHTHLTAIDDSNRITQRALLALLSHGIDGNNL
ncbi:MAG: hypothetical protein E7532_08485, partial [Ruminococcaceae bacterium]|nr:hypothetical protein [Oscillospiraceae bacterium]